MLPLSRNQLTYRWLIPLFWLVGFHIFAQDATLAKRYFREGQFDKAAAIYARLHRENPGNSFYLKSLINSWLELEEYDKIRELVEKKLDSGSRVNPSYWIYMGLVFDKKKDTVRAHEYYNKALQAVDEGRSIAAGFTVARSFKEYHLLDYALKAYEKLAVKNPNSNYTFDMALIYGEMGDIEKMFEMYLNALDGKFNNIDRIKLFINRFLTDDPDEDNNRIFKELLLRKLRDNPEAKWNKLLSWLYILQKEYHKAFIQEKAVYIREKTDLQGILDVGVLALDASDFSTSREAFDFVISHTDNEDLKIQAGLMRLEALRREKPDDKAFVENEFARYFERYGTGSRTYAAQIAYADFLTFDIGDAVRAKTVVERALENRLTPYQTAELQMKLADILVFTGEYSRALVLYTKIQMDFENSPLAHEARYKIARTSYFKGDFKWANIQLKVLKRGTSNLISNDAIDLSLLIDENTGEDSIPRALRLYAKADLLRYQNKYREALDTLDVLLEKYKGREIEDEAMFMQAEIREKTGDYEQAVLSYENILKYHPDDILVDDALYRLGLLYETRLNRPGLAMEYYDKIITGQASSIYLVDARRRYRKLRGDRISP